MYQNELHIENDDTIQNLIKLYRASYGSYNYGVLKSTKYIIRSDQNVSLYKTKAKGKSDSVETFRVKYIKLDRAVDMAIFGNGM